MMPVAQNSVDVLINSGTEIACLAFTAITRNSYHFLTLFEVALRHTLNKLAVLSKLANCW